MIHGFLPGTTIFAQPAGPYARTSDAWVAFDAKHNVWIVSYLAIVNPATGPVNVLVSRSTDGGFTWGTPFVVNQSGDFNDKNWSVCDDTASCPFYGNCYTVFDVFTLHNRVQMSASTDVGVTWGAAQTTPDHTCVIGGQPVVQPTETVIVPIDDCLETTILSFRSTNGGKTWSKPVFAAQILFDGDPGGIRSGPLPSAEMDQSGAVYVVWSDCRFEAFCSAPIGTNNLVLISSADGHCRSVSRPTRWALAPIISFLGWPSTRVRPAAPPILGLPTTSTLVRLALPAHASSLSASSHLPTMGTVGA